MKRLPIGFQTFSEIINENCLYVDKTEDIYNLISGNKARKYYEKYLPQTKNIYLLGVGGFAEREINYAWERA